MRMAMVAAKFTGMKPINFAAPWPHGNGAAGSEISRQIRQRNDRQWLRSRFRRAMLQADQRIRRIRIPREPRRFVCQAGVCFGVDQAVSPGSVCRGAAQQSADGFLCAAQINRDAREHGVEVRPIDVNASEWDCTLEHDGEVSQIFISR